MSRHNGLAREHVFRALLYARVRTGWHALVVHIAHTLALRARGGARRVRVRWARGTRAVPLPVFEPSNSARGALRRYADKPLPANADRVGDLPPVAHAAVRFAQRMHRCRREHRRLRIHLNDGAPQRAPGRASDALRRQHCLQVPDVRFVHPFHRNSHLQPPSRH
eukprot:3934642-Rhodomonas_salina.2